MSEQVVAEARQRRADAAARKARQDQRDQLRAEIGRLRLEHKMLLAAAVEPTEGEKRLRAAIQNRADIFAGTMRGQIAAGKGNDLSLNQRGALEFILQPLIFDAISRLCEGLSGITDSERSAQIARKDSEILVLEARLRKIGG
jgi:hypothetical protein